MKRELCWLAFVSASLGCSDVESDRVTGPSPMTSGRELGLGPATSRSVGAGITGVVVDFLDGQPLEGITVSIPGAGSSTTGTRGGFTLPASGASTVPLVVEGVGFHTRQTQALASSARAEIDLLPVDRAFDLDFFDHVFRNLGADGTERWIVEPRFEIWTGVYDCATGEFESECDDLIASGETAPGHFVKVARDVIASDASKLSGGFVTGTQVSTRAPHTAGERLTWRDYFQPFTITVIMVRGIDFSFAWRWPYESGAYYAGTMQLTKQVHKTVPEVHSHELAHAMGFNHPAGYDRVPLPSIMREARAVTSQDVLHAGVLYRRPPGSRTADEDPADFMINALRAGGSGPPDASRICVVRN